MNAVLGKFAVGEVSPMALVSLRWLGVVLLMAVIAQRQIKRDWPILKKRLVYLLIMGSLGFTGFNTLFYVSAHSTTAVNIGILQGSIPVFVIAAAYFALKDKITPVQGIGVFVTILGVVIVGSGGSFERLAGLELNRGDLMMLAACALYAGYTVALRFKPQVAALSFFAIMAIAALLTSLPFTIVEIQLEHFQAPTSAGWIVVILVTLFPSFIAQLAFIRGVGILGPGRAGVFANLVPVFASIFAVSFLGEPFEIYQGTALILVLFGIWLSERGKRTKPVA
jgi:drug/metabolite transporter (DMT)-like permease